MTISGVDLSRWQAGLTIEQVLAAGHRFVNIQLTKGTTSPNPNAALWAAGAKTAGLIRLGYHWLDASAPGAVQWAACRSLAMSVFGGLGPGWGLQVDTEADATRAHLLEFVQAARADLGRPLVIYTGDWWIDPRRLGDLAGLSPYLWAVPNSGWLRTAPDSLSPHWRWAGANGWSHLSVLQWSAAQKIGGIAVSSSIVRSPEVLCALTGQHVEA